MREPRRPVAPEAHASCVCTQRAQCLGQQPDVMPLDWLHLVDFGRVDVDLRDALGIGRELRRIPRHAIVEARTEREQKIAILYRIVRKCGAMHTQHAHRKGMRGIDRAESHQRGHHGDLQLEGELTQCLCAFGIDHTAACVDQRSLGLAEHAEELFALIVGQHVPHQTIHAVTVAGDGQTPRSLERTAPVLHVLRHIDDDRTWATGSRDLECRANRCFQLGRIGHEEHVLGDGTHEAGHRRFLECIGTYRSGRHLAADHHDRNRIRHAITHRCHGVRRTGTGRHQTYANLAARARIAGGHEACALLVGRNDQRNLTARIACPLLVVDEDGVVRRKDGTAAIAEDGVYAFVGEHLNDDVGAGHLLAGKGMSARVQGGMAMFHGCVSVVRSPLWREARPRGPENGR